MATSKSQQQQAAPPKEKALRYAMTAAALTGILASEHENCPAPPAAVAARAVAVADATLAELAQSNG